MDVLPHNTSEFLPDPCVRSDVLCTPSSQTACEGSFDPAAQADFSQAVAQSISFVTNIFKSEIKQKQLYYHGIEHVRAVARRSLLIFDTVVPFFHGDEAASISQSLISQSSISQSSISASSVRDTAIDWPRQRELLRLSAIAHDMIQLFVPQAEPNTPRRRESGRSELKTFEHLRDFMVGCVDDDHSPLFTAADIALVRCAIAATVCKIDPADGGIYQPLLYAQSASQLDSSQTDIFPLDFFQRDPAQPEFCQRPSSLSLVPRCLALADIGTLGMDGIAAYQKEGSLLLLEENLDIVDFVAGVRTFDSGAQEVLRQRLLKRARFQLVFAKSRLARLDAELFGLPDEVISLLKKTVFKYLTAETISKIERMTPTSENISLREFLAFFQLENCLKESP